MVSEKYKILLLDIMCAHAPQAKVYLFGSRATGDHGDRSDIDLAIDAGCELPIYVLGNLRDSVRDSNIPYFVDVVDMHVVDDTMKRAILERGVLWKE